MDMYQVDENNPPPFHGVEYWERGADPAHPTAFEKTLTVLDRIYHFGFRKTFSKRKLGWFGINQENVEAFVPDGDFYPGTAPDWVSKESSVGLPAAYPVK